jgi:hypothetical protein
MGKFPSHDFHLIEGKFTQDIGETAARPTTAADLAEKFLTIWNLYWIGKK